MHYFLYYTKEVNKKSKLKTSRVHKTFSDMTSCFACKKPSSGCGLTAQDRYFHKACFICCVCKDSLAGKKHYLQDNSYYCVADYQKRWGVKCKVCSVYITGTYTTVGDSSFHNECFKCCVCSKSLASTRHHIRDGNYYCIADFQNKWGTKCHTCKEYLVEEYTTAQGRSFHEQCFKCEWCETQFAPKAKYFLSADGTNILCSACYNHTRDSSTSKPCSPSPTSYPKDQRTTKQETGKTGNFDAGKSSKTVSREQNFSQSPTVKTNDSWQESLKRVNDVVSRLHSNVEEQEKSKSEAGSSTKLDVLSMKMLYKENPAEGQSDGASSSSSSSRRLDESTLRTKKPGKLDESKFTLFENVLQKNIRNPNSLQANKTANRTSVLFSPPVSPISPTTFSQDISDRNNETVTSTNTSRQSSTTSDCVICYDNQVDNIFIPCGHASLCSECAEEYKKSKGSNLECLICRTPSTGIFKIYTP